MAFSSTMNNNYLLAGSALMVAAAAAASIVALKASSGKSKEIASSSSTAITTIDERKEVEDDDEDIEYITADIVCKIFDRLFLDMQGVLAQLSQHIQQLQMAGQMIPEKQLRMVLRQEFERALQVRQGQVFEEYDVDGDCLEEATWEFLEQEEQYPNVKRAVERFQKLWENISGEKVVGKRPGGSNNDRDGGVGGGSSEESKPLLPPEQLIEAAEVYFTALTNAMGGLVQQFKSQGKDLQSSMVAQQLQMEFASVANDAGESALEKFGVTLNQFQKSIETHSANPQVGRALAMLQMKQQQTLMAMGLPA